jgi:cytoskeletal protein RodZ
MNKSIVAMAVLALAGSAALAETMEKTGKTASGATCTVTVEKRPDGSITALGSSGSGTTGSTASSGSLSSSSSAGGSSVHVQAGGGNVSSSSSTAGGPGTTSASSVTVNGCTISTSSP